MRAKQITYKKDEEFDQIHYALQHGTSRRPLYSLPDGILRRDRAAGKVPVFALLKRGGHVYTIAVKDTKANTLIPIIACKVQPDSIVYTDFYRSYDSLDITDFHHMRINHSQLFADKKNHINGIENFWNQAKPHLRRYNGIPRQNFDQFLMECEWRFNYGAPNHLLNTLRKWLKPYSR